MTEKEIQIAKNQYREYVKHADKESKWVKENQKHLDKATIMDSMEFVRSMRERAYCILLLMEELEIETYDW